MVETGGIIKEEGGCVFSFSKFDAPPFGFWAELSSDLTAVFLTAARSGQGTMGGHHMRWPTPFSDALGAELAVSARRTGFLEFVYEQGKYTRESADMTALL